MVAADLPRFPNRVRQRVTKKRGAMARRHWTFVVIADGEDAVRQYRLSRSTVRLVLLLCLFALVGFSGVGTGVLLRGERIAATHRLEHRNAVLEAELDNLRTRLDTLRTSLDALTEKDEYYRLLAGIEPLDDDVKLVGIGGPSETVERSPLWSLNRRAARGTFETGAELNGLLRRARLLAFSWREAEDSLSEKHDRLASTPSIFPTRGYVSSTFSSSRWHPILDRPRPHQGLDIVAPTGTPIVAPGRGRVQWVGEQGEYGLAVEIDHGYGVVTRYAHMSRARARRGVMVQRGDTIGYIGESGLAIGPHLHYEVIVGGKHADPRGFVLEAMNIPD